MKMRERLVLTLDGSTRVCGAALLRPRPTAEPRARERPRWEVVARRTGGDGPSQAGSLLRFVDEMLKEIGRGPEDLGAIVVGTGPGTFTGVRIAVAGARALSLSLGIPVVGVSTLAAMAAGAVMRVAAKSESETATGRRGPELVVPAVDARRGQVFYGVYEAVLEGRGADADGEPQDGPRPRYARVTPYAVCDAHSFGSVLAGLGMGTAKTGLVVGGDRAMVGALPPQSRFEEAQVEPEALVSGQEWLQEPGQDPQGERLAPWLLAVLGGRGRPTREAGGALPDRPGAPGTPEAVRPIYVRSPDADVHILKMRDPFADGAGRGDRAREG